MSKVYSRGYADGIRFVVSCFRMSADKVEVPKRGMFENKELGKTFNAIMRSGDIQFAAKLRQLAELFDDVAREVEK